MAKLNQNSSAMDDIHYATTSNDYAQDELRKAKYLAAEAHERLICALIEHRVDSCLTVNRAALTRLLRSSLK